MLSLRMTLNMKKRHADTPMAAEPHWLDLGSSLGARLLSFSRGSCALITLCDANPDFNWIASSPVHVAREREAGPRHSFSMLSTFLDPLASPRANSSADCNTHPTTIAL